jgi:hypothetical protein
MSCGPPDTADMSYFGIGGPVIHPHCKVLDLAKVLPVVKDFFGDGGLCLLAPFRLNLGLGGLLSHDRGQHLIECFLLGHLLTPFVVLVLMFKVASAAARDQQLFAHHGYDGVVSSAFATRAVIVNVVA